MPPLQIDEKDKSSHVCQTQHEHRNPKPTCVQKYFEDKTKIKHDNKNQA